MPAGMVVTWVVCGAALVQPAPATGAGVELTAGAPCGAQLGGTDNLPTEDARPMPADIGAPPKPAVPAGRSAPMAVVEPIAADSLVPGGFHDEAPGSIWPWHSSKKSDAAAP